MSLKDDFKKKLVEAAKARDQVLLDTLRAIQSAVKYKEIEKRTELGDAEIVSVINTLCKQRRESIDQFKKGGREDLAAKETRELEILEQYLPAQLSRAEVENVIQSIIKENPVTGPSAVGMVMKEAMKRLAGQADGKLVNEIVRELLK